MRHSNLLMAALDLPEQETLESSILGLWAAPPPAAPPMMHFLVVGKFEVRKVTSWIYVKVTGFYYFKK